MDFLYVNINTMLNKWRKDIDKNLASFLKEVNANYKLRLISNTFFNGIKYFLQGKGKRIRPLLFLISYHGYTKKRKFSYKNLLRCCLSFELLHDFMLVHDDVIDKSALRRGKPTLHKFFNAKLKTHSESDIGQNLGIVVGDFIFTLSIDAFLSIEEDSKRKYLALRKFLEAAASTSIGEFIDVIDGWKKPASINEKRVFLNYTLKTAKYTFESPLLTAAILSGAGKKELARISKMAILFGQAFQIQDDMLGVLATSREIGKPILCDLAESKKTLLVCETFKNLNRNDRSIFKDLLEKKTKNYKDLKKFRSLLKKSRADTYCQNKINSLLRQAYSILSKLKMKKKFKVLLRKYLGSLFLRN
ncbi:MAG: polyprenyl synthetase family protein [Candidatus Omnitrophica bacterium]|nr:polyprenyl synthetase family protein [Candidatus Omnitrophota bacterium]